MKISVLFSPNKYKIDLDTPYLQKEPSYDSFIFAFIIWFFIITY